MKYLKMLGLAAVAAMALMAFAGSASATVLCKTTLTTGCAGGGQDYAAGTEINATLKAGTSALLRAGFANITCTESTVAGKTENTGSGSETVRGQIETLDFPAASCNATVHVLKTGELEIHHNAGTDNGTLTGRGSEVTVRIGEVSCTYGTGTGTNLGTLVGGNPAQMNISTNLPKIAGGFLCANPAEWVATYTVTNPKPLYISAS